MGQAGQENIWNDLDPNPKGESNLRVAQPYFGN